MSYVALNEIRDWLPSVQLSKFLTMTHNRLQMFLALKCLSLTCSIGQSRCRMTSKRRIGWFLESDVFSPGRSLNQPKATRVCIRSINQSNRSISVRLLLLFCLRFCISRSWENSSNLEHAGLSSSLSGLFHKSSPQSGHRSKSPPHCLPAALYDISRKMTIVSGGFLRKFDINNS